MTEDEQRLLAAALKLQNIQQKNICYDPLKINSRPTAKQSEILKDNRHRIQYVVAGNQSGKSTLGGRLLTWYFQESHPHWERPTDKECHHCKGTNFEAIEEEGVPLGEAGYRCFDCKGIWMNWGFEPLTLLLAGKVSKMVTDLWETKIKPFLEPGTYKLHKDGNALAGVTNLKNGNKIVFLSHEKAIKAKDKIQQYVAHFVWIDEMPDHYMYLEEAIQRVTSKMGKIVCTFTPKTSNPEIKDMVEAVDPSVGIKYQFGKLDNPINKSPERRAIVLAEVAGLPETVRNAILHGDWMDADDSVFHFDRDRHLHELPEGYNTSWEHMISYDPAANGKGGLITGFRHPEENYWYIRGAEYIKGGKAPSDNIIAVDKKINPFRVRRKIYDCHEAWFMLEFQKLRKTNQVKNKDPWTAVKKHNRKKELITQLQQAMLEGWLRFGPELNDLFNEFTSAQWADGRDDKIKGSQHYHLLDALQYFVDLIPKKEKYLPKMGRDQQIMQAMTLAAAAPKKKRTSRISRRRR